MAEYGKVYKKIWNNPRFRALPESAQHLFLYLISNQHCNLLGLYTLHIGYIMGDLGWSERRTLDQMSALASAGFVEYDRKNSLLFIKSWFEHNPLTSELQTKKALAELSEIPKNPIFMQKLKVVLENGSDQFSKMVLTELLKWFEPNPENGSNSVSESVTVSVSEAVTIPFFEILQHLAQLTGKQFRPDGENNRKWISMQWRRGYRLADFFHVNQVKAEDWLGTKMEKYLRPETLYSNKFEGYRQERRMDVTLTERQRENALAGIKWLQKYGWEVHDGELRQTEIPTDVEQNVRSVPETNN